MRFKFLGSAVILSAMLLCGCREALYSNLTESDANEMLSTLLQRGVDAKKISEGKNGFTIEVDEQDLVRSLEIIKEHSLPREQFQSLGSVFSGQGMISSQTEEQARLAYALSQELSATFSRIDGVLDARVHVVLVQHEQSSGVTTPPSAAVFIRHTKESPVVDMISSIKDTTARSVPGLTHDRVAVMTETFEENVLPVQKNLKPWYAGPVGYVLAGIGGLAIALCLLLGIGKRTGHIKFDFANKDKAADNKEA